MKPLLILTITLSLLLAACGAQTPPTPRVEDIQTAIAQTEAARPTATHTLAPPTETPTLAPSPTPAPTLTPTPSGPISGQVSVAFLNLRAGPSTFFVVIQSMPEGTSVLVTGRDESGAWVQVEIGEETDATEDAETEKLSGWFAADFMTFTSDPGSLPVVNFPFDQQVRVTVQDTRGNPLPGIVVAYIYRTDTETLRTDSPTNDEGRAIAYVPPGFAGTLDVQIVGLDCESPVVDTNCDLSGYFFLEWRTFPVIPQSGPILLTFEVATTQITGIVRDASGAPVVGMLVVAQRDDGAESAGQSGSDGTFLIPAGPGLWEVFTLTTDPRVEGDRVAVEIANTAPDLVELSPP